jgi:hypothetical protein
MASSFSSEALGEPALEVAGFKLWVRGREFPDATDYWDGNWLRVTAHCGAAGAGVWVQGPLIMATDIRSFGEQCRRLLHGQASSATLDPIEPELCLTITSLHTPGRLQVRVTLTPDHLSQYHTMEFEIDEDRLPGIIDQCARILHEYPVRGTTSNGSRG